MNRDNGQTGMTPAICLCGLMTMAAIGMTGTPAAAAVGDVVAGLPGGPIVLAAYVLIITALVYALVVIRRRAARPITELTAYLEAVAAGSADGDVPHIDRDDEIGAMARSVQGCVLRLPARNRLASKPRRSVRRAIGKQPRTRRTRPNWTRTGNP